MSLAIQNLLHGKWRTAVSTGGVGVAIVLVFMQLGFLNAVAATATLIYDHLVFDVMLRSPDYYHFCDPREIPRSYLTRVEACPEVASVRPLLVTLATWRIPENQSTRDKKAGQLRGILAMGIDPTANVFDLPEIAAQTAQLGSAQNLLLDLKTRGKDYGAVDGQRFGERDLGREVEIWDKTFRIAGYFELGAGLAANGSVVMSSAGYARFFPSDTVRNVNFGLVRLQPGVAPGAFCERLREQLALETATAGGGTGMVMPVDVLTRAQVNGYERWRWLAETPIGAIFGIGVIVALVVGGVVVYMVLSNDVANHMHEYATLKAMGYTDGYLSSVVMQQAVAMAILGYVVAWTIAELLYLVVGMMANIPMDMTWQIRGCVLVLSVAMCCVSGVATLRKLKAADPADLF